MVVLLIVSVPALRMPPPTTLPLAGMVWLSEITLLLIVRRAAVLDRAVGTGEVVDDPECR